MNIYAIFALTNCVLAFLVGIIAIVYNPKSQKAQAYSFFMLFMGLWSFFYFLWQIADTEQAARFHLHALMFFVIFVPALHYYHILKLFNLETPFRIKILKITAIGCVILAISLFTPFFMGEIKQKMSFPYWPDAGPFFHIHVLTFAIPIGFSMYLIWEFRAKASPYTKNMLNWLLLAMLLGYGGGSTNWPLWYDIKIPPIANISISGYFLISCLLFFRLGLFDIHLFFRDALVFLSTSLLIGLGIGLPFYILTGDGFNLLIALLASFGLPLIYRPLYSFVKKLFTRIKAWQYAIPLKSVDVSVAEIKESTYTYDDLAKNIVHAVTTTLPVETANVYMFDIRRKEFHLKAQTGMRNPETADLHFNKSAFAIPESDPLINLIKEKKSVLVLDVLEVALPENPSLGPTIERLKQMEADLLAPFLFSGRVMGLLGVARKKNKQLFNQEEIDTVASLARMGEEVMRYITGMETELNHTSLYSHDMKNDMKSILQTIQFLRSPLSRSQPIEKLDALLKKAEMVGVRMSDAFEMSRDRSSLILKSIKGEYEKKPIEVTRLAQTSVDKFQLIAEDKKVDLLSSVRDMPVFVNGNENDLIRVVDNLISNALRYVPEKNGQITVKGRKEEKSYLIQVQDNGDGMNSDDVPQIWNIGWQKGGDKKGSAGFGLAIVKQIVELHGGRISARSEGPGKGMEFSINLPILERESEA